MINFDGSVTENIKERNPNQLESANLSYKMLIIGGSG